MTHSCDCLICHVIILKLIILREKNIFILKGFNDPQEDRLILYYQCDVIYPDVFESDITIVSLRVSWKLNDNFQPMGTISYFLFIYFML